MTHSPALLLPLHQQICCHERRHLRNQMLDSENPKLPSLSSCSSLWRNPCCQSHRYYIIHLPTRTESTSYSQCRTPYFLRAAKRIFCPLKWRVGHTHSRWAKYCTCDQISWDRRCSASQGPLLQCKLPCLLKSCNPLSLGCEIQSSCSSFAPCRQRGQYA